MWEWADEVHNLYPSFSPWEQGPSLKERSWYEFAGIKPHVKSSNLHRPSVLVVNAPVGSRLYEKELY